MKLEKTLELLEEGVKEVFERENFKSWLNTLSKFHSYSAGNIALINRQNPGATYVAGYKTWQNLGRNVMKGQKGIGILRPIEKTEKREVTDANGRPVLDENGKPKKEVIKRWTEYVGCTVFDISQTEGKDLPDFRANELQGDVDKYAVLCDLLLHVSPAPVCFEETDGANAVRPKGEKRIVIRRGMSQKQTVDTLLHEIAHSVLHEKAGSDTGPDLEEIQAESVAYAVCRHFGIDSGDYSFDSIARWSKDKGTDELKDSLGVIRNAASKLISDIDARREAYGLPAGYGGACE